VLLTRVYFEPQRIYGDVVALFYDQMGGTVIAGSWNPLVRRSKPFRALIGYSAMPEGTKKVHSFLFPLFVIIFIALVN
jgi:U3 small nucleolar RNA-associated protein 22